MRVGERLRWALCFAVCGIILIAPAIWNHFPLLQWDTGGYLARWYEGTLVISRAAIYGLMLRAGVSLAFWPVLLAQAGLTVWIVALMLRAHGLGQRPIVLLAVVAALSVFTTLPWLTSILLTDIFCGLGVLALYLLTMRAEAFTRAERVALIGLTALSAATHSATFAVLVALTAAAAVLWLIQPKRMPAARLGQGVLALALGAAIVFGSNYVVAKRLAWTPGGFALSFGRMLQDGIVAKYLDEHCPDARLKLCAVKDEIPQDADTWFWGSDLFDRLGRFAGLDKEMETIALAALTEYPLLQIETALAAAARQAVNVRTGEGVLDSLWHTHGIVERYTPQLAPAMRAARQQNGGIDFEILNELHYPLALLSLALLPVVVLLAWRGKLPVELGELAAVCIVALIANAIVCGAFSNPHDRYGARIVWLAAFAAGLAQVRLQIRLGERPAASAAFTTGRLPG